MVRTAIAALLTIVLVPVLVVANVSTWSVRTVVDDDAFAATIGRSLDTPAVETLLADRVTTLIATNVDLADPAVRLLGAGIFGSSTAPGALEAALQARVLQAIQDPRVEAARDEAVRELHAFLFGAARGTNAVVRLEGPDLVVDLSAIVERAADTIDPRFVAIVTQRLDPTTTRVVVADAEGLQTVGTVVTVLDTLRWVIPLLVVLATILIVVVAHRRERALGIVGVAVMIAGLVSLGIVWLGGTAGVAALHSDTVQDIAGAVYGELTTVLVAQSIVLLAGGAALAIGGWLLFRRRRARAVAR